MKPLIAGVVLLVAACSDSTSGPTSYTVVYRLTASATGIAFDSVRYENPEGTLVKVATPPLNWMVIDTAVGGSYVQGTAWVQGSTAGATATLKVTWTQSGVSTASDSSKATTSAPGAFTLNIPRRQI
jgi:hypothetical protein